MAGALFLPFPHALPLPAPEPRSLTSGHPSSTGGAATQQERMRAFLVAGLVTRALPLLHPQARRGLVVVGAWGRMPPEGGGLFRWGRMALPVKVWKVARCTCGTRGWLLRPGDTSKAWNPQGELLQLLNSIS